MEMVVLPQQITETSTATANPTLLPPETFSTESVPPPSCLRPIYWFRMYG